MNQDDALLRGESLVGPRFVIDGVADPELYVPKVELVTDDPVHGLPVPRLSIDLDELERPEVPPWGGLDEFIRLDGDMDQFPAKVLDFAQRYGVLEICEHGLIRHHWPEDPCDVLGARWEREVERNPALREVEQGVGIWEPLEAWLRYVRHIRAILRIAARLQSGEFDDINDWLDDWKDAEAVIGDFEPRDLVEVTEEGTTYPVGPSIWRHLGYGGGAVGWYFDGTYRRQVSPPKTVDDYLRWRAFVMDAWLQLGDMELSSYIGTPERAGIFVYLEGLPALLATNLLAWLLSPKGIYICFNCGYPFTPPLNGRARKPRRGQKRHWCPHESCGRLAQYRYQNKIQRKRQKEAGGDS